MEKRQKEEELTTPMYMSIRGELMDLIPRNEAGVPATSRLREIRNELLMKRHKAGAVGALELLKLEILEISKDLKSGINGGI